MDSLYGYLALIVVLFTVLRIYFLLPTSKSPPKKKLHRPRAKPCSLAIFLGSGGHTSEALTLLSSLDFARYSPRIYYISQGDSLSERKAIALEAAKAVDHTSDSNSGAMQPSYKVVFVPRARHVHQSILTTPFTASYSLLICIYHLCVVPVISRWPFAEILILNGPGTCCALCFAAYLNKFMSLPSPKIFYIESYARVRSLSLSAKILRPFVDKFIVQWNELLKDGKRGEWRGWLV